MSSSRRRPKLAWETRRKRSQLVKNGESSTVWSGESLGLASCVFGCGAWSSKDGKRLSSAGQDVRACEGGILTASSFPPTDPQIPRRQSGAALCLVRSGVMVCSDYITSPSGVEMMMVPGLSL